MHRTLRILLFSLRNSLCKLDANSVSLIIYNTESKCLEIKQNGVSVSLAGLNSLLIKEHTFKYGVLYPDDFEVLMESLLKIVDDSAFEDRTLVLDYQSTGVIIKEKLSDKVVDYCSLLFTSPSNSFSRWILRFSDSKFRRLYNSYKKEINGTR